MTEPSSTAAPARRAALIFTAAVIALVIAAAMQMFSVFMFYDDEGYVLMSVRNYVEHGGLYREVYTQYGPFPFVIYHAFHALGMPLTHTAGRILTIAAWAGAALSCAVITGQATRSLAARLAVLAAVFAYLWIMASEPSHPGGMIVLLTTLIAAVGHHCVLKDRLRGWALAIGAVVAALLLTKINVGAFVGWSAVVWWALHHRSEAVRKIACCALPLLTVALPFVLMRALLGTPWVQTYAIVFACSAAAAVMTVAFAGSPRTDGRHLGWGALGAGAIVVVVLGTVFARGTTPADLLEGILLGPMRQPVSFSLRYLWPPGAAWIAVGSLGLCLAAQIARRRKNELVDVAVAGLRLVIALALALNVVLYPRHSPDYLVFGWVMPCLWILLWSLPGETNTRSAARAWVGLVLLGQCLHIFPVPGSQIAWGTVLTLPLVMIAAWDAATWLAGRFPARTVERARACRHAMVAVVAALAVWTGGRFIHVAQRYREGSFLGLPGAELLRLPENASALFRLLSLNAAAHGDLLFSLPGMYSLNLWSETPTPTKANVTHWFSLLKEDQQRAIIERLEAHPRACLVVHRQHVEFLAERGLKPRGPLFEYVEKNFTPAFVVDDFEFSVRRGRTIVPFHIADILARADASGAAMQGPEDTLLEVTLLLQSDRAIARVEVTSGADGKGSPLILNQQSARVAITPVNLRGEPQAAAETKSWPFRATGPCRVSFFYERQGKPRPLKGGLMVLRDAAGEEIETARLAK